MAKDQHPVGELFSRLYLNKGDPTDDSRRFRRRLAAQMASYHDLLLRGGEYSSGEYFQSTLAERVETRLGVPCWLYHKSDYAEYLEKWPIRDVLDIFTLVWQTFTYYRRNDRAKYWREFVESAFREENLRYTIDEQGGVRYWQDEEFERSRAATIAALGTKRYQGAHTAFEKAYKALDHQPPDTRGAVASVFDAVESVFKLACGDRAIKLAKAEVDKHLRPLLHTIYGQDETAHRAADKLANALVDWTDAMHFYRHASGKEHHVAPPTPMCIHLMSTGAAYLRWLVEIDSAQHKPTASA